MAHNDISGYSLRRALGSGSAGTVWLLRDRATGRHTVLKRIPKSTVPAPTALLADLELTQTIDHPHIARLLELRESDREWLLFTQYVAAGTLTSLLERRGALSSGELVTLINPLAQALSLLHRTGLHHGQLTTHNIMFDADGRPVITDAGLRSLAPPTTPAADLQALSTIAQAAGNTPKTFPPSLFTTTPDALAQHALHQSTPLPIDLGFTHPTTPTPPPNDPTITPSASPDTQPSAPPDPLPPLTPPAITASSPKAPTNPSASADTWPSTPATPDPPPPSLPPTTPAPSPNTPTSPSPSADTRPPTPATPTRLKRLATTGTSQTHHRSSALDPKTPHTPEPPTPATSSPLQPLPAAQLSTHRPHLLRPTRRKRLTRRPTRQTSRQPSSRSARRPRSRLTLHPITQAARQFLSTKRAAYGILAACGAGALTTLAIGLATLGVLGEPANSSTTAADQTTHPSQQPTSPPATPTTSATTPPRPRPTAGTNWLQTLKTLDTRRTRAFTTLNDAELNAIYLPGSPPWTADHATIASYREQHLRIEDLRFQINSVTVEGTSKTTVVLRIVDRLISGTAITPAGHRTAFPQSHQHHGRITLTATGTTWRISAITTT